MGNNNIVYSAVARNKRVPPPSRVIVAKNISDIITASLQSPTPRYELSRGIEGDFILDLSNIKGILEKDDEIEVLAGTTWREVRAFSPEIFCNESFSVAGSVFFNDGCFGDNQFFSISKRVKVKEVSNGEINEGMYSGGIIYSVIIKKEKRKLVTVSLNNDLENIKRILKELYSPISPFRDVTVVKDEEGLTLYLTYVNELEKLVSKFTENCSISSYPVENIEFPHNYRYFGRVELNIGINMLDSLIQADKAFFRFSKNSMYFSLYSIAPLQLDTRILYPFSDDNDSVMNECIMCGKCVNICPRFQQTDNKSMTPMGFFISSSPDTATCNLCGICDNVCPVHIDITRILRKTISPNLSLSPIPELYIPKPVSVVITPLSFSIKDYALKGLLFIQQKVKDVGILMLNIDFNRVLREGFQFQVPKEVSTAVFLTPEEYHYLKNVFESRNIEVKLLHSYLNIAETVHVGCLIEVDGDRNCSGAFINMINGHGLPKVKTDAKVSLCPIAAKALGINDLTTYMNIDVKKIIDAEVKDLGMLIKKKKEIENILYQIEWFKDIDNEIYEKYSRLLRSSVSLPAYQLAIILLGESYLPESYKEVIKSLLAA
ncbi:hypothetical protein HS7_08760 [Sulfolobales archaeon HS-7]|nr:hypothetical protein HS7_08760 [Sulfolobales archaeon HS-7]